MVVYKTDAEGEPLEGAVIALMVGSDLTTGGETIYAEQEADENGEALFSRLPDGSYTVVEEYAPDGYEKTDETFRLDVFEGEATLTINGVDGISPEDHPMVFVNGFADNSMDVAVTDGLGNPVPGAKVTITDEDGKDEETTTDRRGHAHFLNLPDGKYTIRVPEVPSPLVPPEREAAIIVDNGVIRLDDGAYAPPLVFVSYKEVALNKTDHFAFLKGYPDGTFGQSRNMTRAEVTVMFARLITEKMDADSTYKSTFSDVPADAWYAGYVGFMQQFGIIRGYSDGTFKPDAPISRAEFATIACRFDALTAGTATFSDVPADHWAAKYISFAADKGWVTGYTDGTFHPAANITRAEVAAVTCRLLERSADKGYVTANYDTLPRTYSDIADGNWAFWYAMESSNGHDYSKAADGAETWSKVYE